jgi:hypothetical protein
MQDHVPPFWLSILAESKTRNGEDIAFAALNYCEYPSTVRFPLKYTDAPS